MKTTAGICRPCCLCGHLLWCSDVAWLSACRCVCWTRFHFICLSLCCEGGSDFYTSILPSLKWVFIQTAPLIVMQRLVSGVTAGIHYLLEAFFLCVCVFFSHSAISEKIWRCCYQASIPTSPFKMQFYPSPLHPSFSGRCVIRGFLVSASESLGQPCSICHWVTQLSGDMRGYSWHFV